jgi:hypothetical protein
MLKIFWIRRLGGTAALAITPLLVGCASSSSGIDNEDPGRIVGRVTIGPLCPVEQVPPDPACQPTPQTFAPIRVRIRLPAGNLLLEVRLDGEGNYSVDLPAGRYLVDTNHVGIAPTPPIEVTLSPGETERVDIDIDTGIR